MSETFSANGHKRAVLYARVSSDDTSKDGRNLASQLEMCREYATDHGYPILAELHEDDRGASGASFELPQLANVLSMAERSEFDVLVVRELDRLSRNLAKQLIVEETLQRAGVVIEYVLGEYPDTPEGNLSKHIRATVAEFEREKIKERNTRGRRNVVKGGRIMLHGDRPPFGYRVSKDGKNLVIHEPEARIVRMIFDWYTVGDENGKRLSSIKIARRLSEMGVPTWADVHNGGNKQARRGKWCDATIGHILRNETYKGTWHYGRQAGKGKGINSPEHWIPLEVPAIIAPAQWDRAQAERKQNVILSERNVSHEYLMRYRVKGACNYAMGCVVGHSAGRTYLYYTGKGANTNRHTCDKCHVMFRADWVDTLTWDCLKEYFQDPDDLRNKLAEYNAGQDKINAPILALLKANDDLIAENQAQLARIKDMCQAKIITLEEAVDRKTRLEDTITRLEEGRGDLEARLVHRPSDEEIEGVMRFAYDVSRGVANADKSFEKRRRIIEVLNVRAILTVEEGEKVCNASFILAQGEYSKRLVLPHTRGKLFAVASSSS